MSILMLFICRFLFVEAASLKVFQKKKFTYNTAMLLKRGREVLLWTCRLFIFICRPYVLFVCSYNSEA